MWYYGKGALKNRKKWVLENKLKGATEYYMVKLKYAALYTDNLGCEQARVHFSEDGFKFKVRNCIFEDNDFNFDFYAKNPDEIKHLFYLKEDELIEYFIDIKIPMILTYNNQEAIKEFLLSIKRDKNHYNNSLSFNLNDEIYKVEGYDLHELLKKMKNELPIEYNLESNFSALFRVGIIDSDKANSYNDLESFDKGLNTALNKKSDLNLFGFEIKKKYEKFEKIPFNYICNKYCLS